MTYDEIRKELTNQKRFLVQMTKSLSEKEEELVQVRRQKENLSAEVDRILKERESEEKDLACYRATKNLRSELDEIKRKIVELEREYEEDLESLREENILEEVRSKNNVPTGIEDSIEEVKDLISSDIGERFTREYVSQVDTYDSDIGEETLSSYYNSFRHKKEKIESLSKGKKLDKIYELSSFMDSFFREKVENSLKGVGILVVILVPVYFLLAWILFPIYIFVLGFIAYNNMRKGYVFSQALTTFKVVEDNLERIEERIWKEVEKEKAKRVKEIEESFYKKQDSLSSERKQLERDIEETYSRTFKEYEFDATSIISEFESKEKIFLDKERTISDYILSKRDEFEKTKENIQLLEKKLNDTVNGLKSQYLSFDSGEDTILDPSFLIDIKDNKPTFFKHPETSSMFVYDDYDSMIDFIKLLTVQIRAKLRPFNFKISLWDTQKMGRSFLPFSSETSDLFEIISQDGKIMETVDDLNDILMKRVEIVLRESDNLSEYNKRMIELDSVTESYYFLFALDVSEKLVGSEKLLQLVTNGGSVGIYNHLFVSSEKLNDKYLPLAQKCDKFYFIRGGGLQTRAKDLVLENLMEFEN